MPGSFSPIQETQVGAVAYLFGITNNGTHITMQGSASPPGGGDFELESLDLNINWTEKVNKDATGNDQNFTQTNFKYEQTIRFNPSGTTRANAASMADYFVNSPTTFTQITLANCKVPSFNGSWRIKPGVKLSLKMDDNATIDIPCEKYINTQQNSALTGTPISG